MKIKAHNISYKYESSSKNAISNIDLEITQGEKVVIIGANGCGKTTLLKVLCGLYKPTQGDIMIEGRAVKPSPSFNFLVGLVPENPAEMFFEESVEREVNFILKRKKVDKETQKVTVDNTLTQFGLLKLKNRTPFELSGGEKKKLAFAANVIANQKFIFLDEPTADLDFHGIKMIEHFICNTDCGILATTHRTDFASMFDRVVLMNGGTILNDNINLLKNKELLEKSGIVLLKRI